jgi:hypothetical protein
MTRLPQPGSDDGTWGDILNDFLAQAHNADGSLKQLTQSQVQNLTNDLAAKALVTDVVANTDLDTKTSALIVNASSTTATSLKTAIDAEALAQYTPPADYVITKVGTTITATPRAGTGLSLLTGSDAYTVIQGAISALTVPGGGGGSAGGHIHISRGLYSLSNELTIVGWEGIATQSAQPRSQLVISGDGYSTRLLQNTAGKNALVVSNLANFVLRDLGISCGLTTALSAILLDNSGTDSEMSCWGSVIDNVDFLTNSTTAPAAKFRNFFELSIPKANFTAGNNSAIVVENASTTTNYGNSKWGQIRCFASSSSPYAGMSFVTTSNTKWPNLMTIDNYQCMSAYYGIYSKGLKFSTFGFVDIEATPRPIYFDGGVSGFADETRYNTIQSGYLLTYSNQTMITQAVATGGNFIRSVLQLDSTVIPIADASNFRPSNAYDLAISDATARGLISIANTTGTELRIDNGDGTVSDRLPVGAVVNPRVVALTDAATITPNIGTTDVAKLATLSQASTIANPSGTKVDGQLLTLRIKSISSQTLTWGVQYRAGTSPALPAATTGSSKTDYLTFAYNSADNKWDLLSTSLGH